MKINLITPTLVFLLISPSLVMAHGDINEKSLDNVGANVQPKAYSGTGHLNTNATAERNVASQNTADQEQSNTEASTQPEEIQTKEVETVDPFPDVTLTECLNLTRAGTKWETILAGFKADPSSIPSYWVEELNQKALEAATNGADGETADLETAKNQFIAQNAPSYGRCIGYSFVLATREEFEFQGKIKKSHDEKLVCTNYGFHTMDYEACASMVNAYDLTAVAQVGLTTFQSVDYQNATNKMVNDLSQDPTDPTGALKAQKKSLKKQEDIANEQAVFFTTKAATLLAMQQRMPTKEDLVQACQTLYDQVGGAKAINQQLATIPNGEGLFGDLSNLCVSAVNSPINFLPNLEARDTAKAIMAGDAFQAAAKVAQAALIHKNAKHVNTAITNVEAFDPSENVMQPGEVKPNCALNPNDPRCKIDTDNKTDIGFNDSGFDVGGGWGGNNNINSNVDIADDNWTGGATQGDSSTQGGDKIGTPIADANNGSGFEVEPPAPGTVKTKEGGNDGGAGGGGGVTAVGLPSGGGNGGYGGDGGMMAGSETPSKTKMGYGGGSGVKYGNAATGRKIASKTKPQNPFDALFNKKKGGNKNGVLNFRDPASSQIGEKNGKSLFEMISHRYQVSQEKKRLLEYDVVEK